MQTNQTNNHLSQHDNAVVLKRVRKTVYQQAALAVFMVVLIAVVIFAATSAWYTNVAQTSGLIFDVSGWGFDGTITENTYIKAAPGDEGMIPLTVENDSDAPMAVSVNISKSSMDPEMQKRLYFYVDTPKAITYEDSSGAEVVESAERIYFSNAGNYTYTLFNHNDLILSETVRNGPLLKWHWVYDVLGYYVLGALDTETDSVTVEEYLRPIEYDYDEATTTFEVAEDGTLTGRVETVDGEMTPEEFLYELSKTDGYAGTIDAAEEIGGYYPVEVSRDENGNVYGVWAYLCSYTEIMNNTAYDIWLGEQAAVNASGNAESEGDSGEETENPTDPTEPGETAGIYVATLTMIAQNSDIRAVEVSTPAALYAVLAAAKEAREYAAVQMTSNVTLVDGLLVAAGEKVLLDLNGNTLTVPAGADVGGIQVEEGGSLTVTNGTLETVDGSGRIMSASGAEIAMSGVTVTDANTLLYLRDDQADAATDSRIHLVDCAITTAQSSLMIYGDGTNSAQSTSLVVEGCTIDSTGYIGIVGSGNGPQWGTDIQIINSTVKGLWSGIYHPQSNSALTISNNSVIEGYTALAIKGGSVCVLDSTITGTGSKQSPGYAVSGFTDTGDAIYIEANYNHEILVDIGVTATETTVGETIVTSTHGYALQVYEPDADNVKVNISGGIFSTDVSGYLADGCVIGVADAGDYAGMYCVGVGAVEPAMDESEPVSENMEEAASPVEMEAEQPSETDGESSETEEQPSVTEEETSGTEEEQPSEAGEMQTADTE